MLIDLYFRWFHGFGFIQHNSLWTVFIITGLVVAVDMFQF